jgi:hypothetical protein
MAQLIDRMIHVRFDGRSTELPASSLQLANDANDAQIKRAIAGRFDLPPTYFDGYVLVRTSTTIIVRPEAIYG